MRTIRRGGAAAFVLFAVVLVTGCNGVLGTGSDDTMRQLLDSRQRIWQERGPAAYTMTVTRLAADTEALRDVVLHVAGGAIQSAEWADTGQPVPSEIMARYYTVDGLFDLIRDALNRRVPGVTTNYDADLGYPREIILDYNARRADDDLYFRVSDLTADD